MVAFFFLISALLISLGKGIADIVSDESNWSKSIFSKYKIDSFFGCKDMTWERKYRDNKILNYLLTTIFVFVTDIWHFANFINKVGFYLALSMSVLLPGSLVAKLVLVLIHLFFTTVLFHILYHSILRK